MGELASIIKTDLYRHNRLKGIKGFLKAFYSKPGFKYTLFLRLTAYKQGTFLWFLWAWLKRRYRFKYGYDISYEAKIGKGFYLSDHIGPVVIGPVTIGEYCNVNHNVTIGRAYRKGVIGRPTIGDRVWIGTGSVLVGHIKIGSNVMIAPNSFVNMDVPDNSIVMGVPAKIIPRENPTQFYIMNIIDEMISKS
jgi:serine O-acetyltransferase